MIRDFTHNTKEIKHGTTTLVGVHMDLFTPTQKPSQSIGDY